MHRLNTTSEGEMLVDEAQLPITRSQYCDALDALRAAPAHYLKEVGDQWRTPDLLFWGVNAMYGPLVLDLFADESNAKCPAWYSAEDNALTQDWAGRLIELGGAAFGNPPYSRSQYHEKQAITGMTHIMSYASAQREKGGRYVFLVKSATSETWWPEDADHVCFIRGRIGFDLPTCLSRRTISRSRPAPSLPGRLLYLISPGEVSALAISIVWLLKRRGARVWP